jgi:hypothetical protein
MPTNAESFELEAALRREAAGVRDDLELEARLRHIGVPVLVGSAAMHVMVSRDLDLTTICRALDPATAVAITALGAALACHPRVRQVQIRDDTGAWNVDPDYPDGWYLGLHYRSASGAQWTLDLVRRRAGPATGPGTSATAGTPAHRRAPSRHLGHQARPARPPRPAARARHPRV